MTAAMFLSAALLLCTTQAAPPVTAVAFSPDGSELVVGSQAGIEVRDWPGLKPSRALPTGLRHVHDLAFSPDGKRLAAAGGAPGEHGGIELFDWPGGELIRRRTGHEDAAYALAWAPDSATVASAGLDQVVVVWDAGSGEIRQRLRGHSRGVTALTFLPDGRGLVSGGLDQSIRVWDLESGEARRALDNHTRPVHGLALRPGGEGLPLVASAGEDGTVRFWQPTIGRMVRFARTPSPPLTIAWLPDGSRVAAACEDGAVRLIDPETAGVGRHVPAVEGWAYALAIHPRGATAVVGGRNGVLLAVPLLGSE